MKSYKALLYVVSVLGISISCAENNWADFEVEKPEDIIKYEYLNEYSTLRSYVDDASLVSVGAAVNTSDIIKGEILYGLVGSNFNELYPLSGMWHGDCVQNDGSMNFQPMKTFFESAQKINMTVFGHAICSSENQNVTYLNTLLADKPLSDEQTIQTRSSSMKKEYLVKTDFENGLTIEGGKWSTWGDAIKNHGNFWKVVEGEGYNGTKGYKIIVGSGYAATKGQTVVQFSPEIPAVENTTYYLNLKVKASRNCTISSEFRENGSSTAIGKFTPNIDVSTEWKEVTVSCPNVSGNIYRFYLNVGEVDGTIWFDDISVYYEIAGGIPQTPEEKKDTLIWAMDQWIGGLMEASKDVVENWNVIDKPLAVVDMDGDGYYDLQSVNNGNDSDFYWGDYLGADYPRIIVELVRRYGPENLNLYVNETDLIADFDRLKSLIHWINQWESDNKTVIDGISTTMHLTYMLDETAQELQEEHIKNAFAQLAATGKLIRISALDMNMVDVTGIEVPASNRTLEQEKKMSDFYTFVLSTYAEQVPAKQWGGIVKEKIVDDERGLWSKDYMRKPVYAGFAEGLRSFSKSN